MKNAMRKTATWLTALTLVLGILTLIPGTARAWSQISGSTGGTEKFYVMADSGSAYIKLQSYKGTADVMHNGSIRSEQHYGFYTVTVRGSGYNKTYRWCPDATLPDLFDTVEGGTTLKIGFPSYGTYAVTVMPMSAGQISGLWWNDSFRKWTSSASWEISDNRSCSLSRENPDDYTQGIVSVKCYDTDGNLISAYQVTLTSSQTVNPISLSGYRAQSGGVYVTFDRSTGLCSPSAITFTYRGQHTSGTVNVICRDENNRKIDEYTETVTVSKTIYPRAIRGYSATSYWENITFNAVTGVCSPSTVTFYYRSEQVSPPAPGPSSDPVPTGWDTKFKPSTSTKNPNVINRLDRLTDGNPGTYLEYVLYNSDKQNGLPDFTAYFNSAAVSGIRIRNGDGGNYERYMRINTFYVKVVTNGGTYTEQQFTVPDRYSPDYYGFAFRQRYTGVIRIEIYITDRNVGIGEYTNYVRIRDIAFY